MLFLFQSEGRKDGRGAGGRHRAFLLDRPATTVTTAKTMCVITVFTSKKLTPGILNGLVHGLEGLLVLLLHPVE